MSDKQPDTRTIYVDAGNSMIKASVRPSGEWESVFRGPSERVGRFIDWLESQKENRVVICSVLTELNQSIDQSADAEVIRLTSAGIPTAKLDYKTPQTLGPDRFFSCFGASLMTPGHVVVIDAGTACTVDLMTSDGIYRGGVIAPGLEWLITRFSESFPALTSDLDDLPDNWPGRSTSESVSWGTTGMLKGALHRYLETYKEHYGEFNLYLTGGESGRLEPLIGDKWGPKYRPNLIFEGMLAADRDRFWT